MRFYKYLFACICLLGSMTIFAQNRSPYPVRLIPDTLMKGADEFILYDYTETQINKLNELKINRQRVIAVLNESSYYRDLEFHYSPNSTIEKLRVTVYNALGEKVESFSKKDFDDVWAYKGSSFLRDDRILQKAFSNMKPPYWIEISEERVDSEMAATQLDTWLPLMFSSSIQYGAFVVFTDNPEDLTISASNGIGVEPQVIPAGNNSKRLFWEVKNLKPIKYESMIQYPVKELLPYLRIGRKSFSVEGIRGSFDNWASFGQFMNQLHAGLQDMPQTLKNEVDALTAGMDNEQDIIQTLYNHMQDNTRYLSIQLGIGGWRPFSAEYVWENRYGDCKALSNYMRAMLAYKGIVSYPVIVLAGQSSGFSNEMDFTYNYANHMILYVPSQDQYLECTSNINPTGYLGDFTSDRNVIVLFPDGAKIMKTPAYDRSINQKKTYWAVDLDEDGHAQVSMDVRNQGSFFSGLAERKRIMSEKDMREWFLEDLSLNKVVINTFEVSAERKAPVSTLKAQLSLERYATQNGSRIFVPLIPHSHVSRAPKAKTRQHAFESTASWLKEDTTILTIPANFRVEAMPKPFNIEEPYGHYQLSVTEVEPNVVQVVRSWEAIPFDAPAEAWGDYRKFRQKVARMEKTQMVLVKKKT